MTGRDWFVDERGQCQPRPRDREWDLLRERYYLHQFLTEILDILANAPDPRDEWDYLPQIRKKVRQLIVNSYWVKTQYAVPEESSPARVTTLYDEIGYPLTVQNAATLPGSTTSIHNHGTWGIVFQIRGEDRHYFWRRADTDRDGFAIEATGDRHLQPGDMLSFHPDAIHQVETLSPEPAVTFQLYGDTQPKGRFQFDVQAQRAKPF